MIDLPERFLARMRTRLGDGFSAFLNSYNSPAARAVRVNTLKLDVQDFARVSPFPLSPVPWEPSGFYVDGEKIGKTVLHAAGAYYVQEPSAMCAAPLLNVIPGERVLDLCSAPGGKGTQLAQKMAGEGVIYLNEINFSRAKILLQNVERLGITNAVVTCADPQTLARCLPGVFDKVLVDAPCSGEGMFKKEPNAVSEWSEHNVAMCADRQAKILNSAASLVAPGGSLVYSTCTFSEEEDELQARAFVAAHPGFALVKEHKLWPHAVRGEGHYAALFESQGGEADYSPRGLKPRADRAALRLFEEFAKQYLNAEFSRIHSVGDKLYCLPSPVFDVPVQTLRAGILLGEVAGGRFTPSHSLAMCLKRGDAAFLELDEPRALKYLSGNVVECPSDVRGWVVASYLGLPLGWCKASGGVAKNHLPKGLRI